MTASAGDDVQLPERSMKQCALCALRNRWREPGEVEEEAPQEEWPDESDIRRARSEAAKAATPIPEQIWALRNSAQTLAMTGAPVKVRRPTVPSFLWLLIAYNSGRFQWIRNISRRSGLIIRCF